MRKVIAAGWISLLSPIWLTACIQDSGSEGATTPGYVVANFRITDAEAYAAYPPLVRPMLAAHGAEILAADGETEVIEGRAEHRTVIIRFPSKDAARAFYDSPEYREIVHLRTDNSDGFLALMEGVGAPDR